MSENPQLDIIEEILGGVAEPQAQGIKKARASGGTLSDFTKSAEQAVRLMRENLRSSAMTNLQTLLKAGQGGTLPAGVKTSALESAAGRRVAAYVSFYLLVDTGRPWDIKRQFQQWSYDPVTEKSYLRDIWGNVHYGYLGNAAGFSEFELFSGAGVNQVGNHLGKFFEGESLKKIGKIGFGIFDDPKDIAAIRVGMKLWSQTGSSVSVEQLSDLLRASASSLNTK